MSQSPRAEVVVATFNVHGGVDGWGRPFDVVQACKSFDADLIVLQETWKSDGRKSMADQIAGELGYEAHEMLTATGRLSGAHPHPEIKWKPTSRRLDGPRVVLPDRTRAAKKIVEGTTSPTWPDDRKWPHGAGSDRGSFLVAVLSRLPVVGTRTYTFRDLKYDNAERGALRVDVSTDAGTLAMVGTHMSHLSRGSPIQIRELKGLLAKIDQPTVVAGDMNLWGPPLVAQMPGWRRAVKGRTWPCWGPHSQPDHILVRDPVVVLKGEVLPSAGSDHLPIRARIAIP